jgi:neutral ceramidase
MRLQNMEIAAVAGRPMERRAMRGISGRAGAAGLLALAILAMSALTGCSRLRGGGDFDYLIGQGRRDITGPLADVQMWGFVREGQTTAGLHFRLASRAFVIADAQRPSSRLVLVVADLGSIPHMLQREVVDRLQKQYGELYRLDNVIVSATHTHSGPGGYWHYGAGSPLGGDFYEEHFNALAQGIVDSVVDAHEAARPARILIARGEVEGAGANRSTPAYLNNPEDERARYEHDTDRTMTLLKFVGEDGEIGTINWFAVHPTSMTYDNRLISGDHKGHAAQEFEARYERSGRPVDATADFVAAFANANCGDVTPNLNLDNTGPGENEFESTRIIGERQLAKALDLYAGAHQRVSGRIESRQGYVDFSQLEVGAEFTGGELQRTCPSAYGYAFAAGSTEDGGGHPLFREGMTERVAMIDGIAAQMFGHRPSDEIRLCHLPKAVLFAPGEMDPPAQAQVLPLGIARIGPLVIVAHPGEITTMAGRRVRETVAAALETTPEWVVIAAYANDFSGYTTTYEEYQTQQYEGGHTLYGPWQLAGYQQEYDRLARAMAKRRLPPPDAPEVRDLRGKVESVALGTPYDKAPEGADFGDVIEAPREAYDRGTQVRVAFWSGNPQNGFRTGGNTVSVERRGADVWVPALTDRDWSTKLHWSAEPPNTKVAPDGEEPEPTYVSRATITWDIPRLIEPGQYRIVYHGTYRSHRDGTVRRFDAATRPFTVR